MAVPRLRLSDSQAKDLLQVCKLGAGRLDDLTAILNKSSEAPIISRAILRSRMSKAIPDDLLEPTSRILVGLALVARDNFGSKEECLSSLDNAVNALEWTSDERECWRSARSSLINALYARDLIIASKAMDLIFDFEKFCLNSRIITDIRPVFDDDRNTIVGGIIMHTLRIEYRAEDGNRKNLSIELDSRDIERLLKSCSDATKKMEEARKLLGNLPVITATEGLE